MWNCAKCADSKERGIMAGYRRFIAYVYEYPDGKKGNGKGFIKVESRDGTCRMQYRLAGVCSGIPMPTKIYGYVRENQACKGILLGTCDLAGDSIRFEQEMSSEHMGDSSYSLEDLCGLILRTDSGIFYGSGWDDKPVQLQEMILPEEGRMQAAEQNIVPKEGSIDVSQEEIEEIKTEPKKIIAEEVETEPQSKMESIDEQNAIRDSRQEQREAEEIKEVEEVQQQPVPIMPTAEEPFLQEPAKESVEEEPFRPAMGQEEVFCDNSFSNCRKLTREDFGLLNRKDQGLLYNNFLRHGYGKFGYVILARREEDGAYILGIPGFYERQEALMANMFGFPYFKETGGNSRQNQQFGYWYRFIEKPNLDSM